MSNVFPIRPDIVYLENDEVLEEFISCRSMVGKKCEGYVIFIIGEGDKNYQISYDSGVKVSIDELLKSLCDAVEEVDESEEDGQ